jgi:hypothetical protein
MLVEGRSFLDALDMTITTVTTVGYREVQPLGTAGPPSSWGERP